MVNPANQPCPIPEPHIMMPLPNHPPSRRGVINGAAGRRYLENPHVSVESQRKTNFGLPVHPLTNRVHGNPSFEGKKILITTKQPGNASNLHLAQTPRERRAYINSDTTIEGSLDTLFALLGRFKFAAIQHNSGHHYTSVASSRADRNSTRECLNWPTAAGIRKDCVPPPKHDPLKRLYHF